MDWNTDWELRVRMGGVLVLLAALYAIFLGAIGLYLNSFLTASLIIGAVVFGQFWYGPNLALRLSDARRVSPSEYPELHSRVNRLAHQAGMPAPDVAVSSSAAPNAFASGRSTDSAVVCVTEGLLDSLEGEELDAVLAHELAHVKNSDVLIMMVASTLSAIAFFIVRWGWLADGGDNGNVYILGAILTSFFVWIASYFLIRVLSRYREYAADRGGVAITGRPMALASALATISDTVEETPDEDLRTSATMNAMNFYEIEADRISSWLKTHPDVENRIERLRDLESERH